MSDFNIYLETLLGSEKLAGLAETGIRLLLTVIIGLIVIKVIMKITKKSLGKSGADPSVYAFIKNAVKIVCAIVLVTMCLGILGIPMSTVVAVLGAAGAAIALALRDSLANIAGGFMIIITKPFSKDDLIDVGEVSGKVEKIDLFLTTLKTYDNKTIT
ncbi:MAG: mechanosensitive ion channel, partial [Firmicutes bacterium]|nr:mechanosensitive ion channel [Bacillota bacterium]